VILSIQELELEHMKLPDLKEMAKKLGIKNLSKYKKNELMELIEEAQKQPSLIDNIEEIEYTKEEQIKKLIVKGYKDEEICKDLNIGRGELLLIKKCYQL